VGVQSFDGDKSKPLRNTFLDHFLSPLFTLIHRAENILPVNMETFLTRISDSRAKIERQTLNQKRRRKTLRLLEINLLMKLKK